MTELLSENDPREGCPRGCGGAVDQNREGVWECDNCDYVWEPKPNIVYRPSSDKPILHKPKQVMYKDAATKTLDFKTSTGHDREVWESADGNLYFRESAARYAGCTHVPCEECGEPAAKMYSYCKVCRDKRAHVHYEAMPSEVWNGETPLYSREDDEYFMNEDELHEYMLYEFDEEVKWDDLQLVLCKPRTLHKIESEQLIPSGTWGEYTVPGDIEDVIDELNEVIENSDPVVWYPGNVRAVEE